MNAMHAMLATIYDRTLWMPKGASTFAEDLDWLFYFTYYVSIFFFVLIGGLMFWFAWKYRQTDKRVTAHGSHHNNTLEITWSVIPLIIVLAIFIWGFRGFLDMRTPPGEAYEIYVDANKWSWNFTYPEGVTSPVLHVPADTPIRLVLNSQDVIHSLFVPAFRTKMDVVPGRFNKMWFHTFWDDERASIREYHLPGSAFRTGQTETWEHPIIVYDLYCTEYCGTRHSWMWSKVVVHHPDNWRDVIRVLDTLPEDPMEAFNHVHTRRGCNQCHSLDGSSGIGPTFRDLFGAERRFTDGTTAIADEDYIVESIRYPGRLIVQGYANQMPVISLRDDEMRAIIWGLRNISRHAGVIAPGEVAEDEGELPAQVVPERPHPGVEPGQQGID
jgi:cytochrome c oxidase subunit 2